MTRSTIQRVRARAKGVCEYCRLDERAVHLAHVVDHIVARQHRGGDDVENLALACGRCNSFKGPNLAGRDPLTNAVTCLFNPRTDVWADHFKWDGLLLSGRTDIGRTTVDVLAINADERVALRSVCVELGFDLTTSDP